jgi:hypothetical protein
VRTRTVAITVIAHVRFGRDITQFVITHGQRLTAIDTRFRQTI